MNKIALITADTSLCGNVRLTFPEFQIDHYTEQSHFVKAAEEGVHYVAVIYDTESDITAGISVRDSFYSLHQRIPFMLLANSVTDQEKVLCLRKRISEVFVKPLLFNNLKIRLQYYLTNINVDTDDNCANNHPKPVRNCPDVIFRCKECKEKNIECLMPLLGNDGWICEKLFLEQNSKMQASQQVKQGVVVGPTSFLKKILRG